MKKIIIAALMLVSVTFLVSCGAESIDSPGYDVDYIYPGDGELYNDYWDDLGVGGIGLGVDDVEFDGFYDGYVGGGWGDDDDGDDD